MNPPKIVTEMALWPIDRLIPYTNNPLTHPEEQVVQISISIQEHGMVNPILVDKDGNVIAGHGRILAAQLIGLTELPVIVLDHLTPAQARALRIADNKIAANARWDEEKLCAELAALLEEKIDLTSLGFSELELKRVLAELDHQIGHIEDDAVPDPPQHPITIPGDLWILPGADRGDENVHRVLCGDATSLECLNQVLEGQKADLVYADPPYNVNYRSPTSVAGRSGPILNDNLGKDFGRFLYASCVAILAVSGGAIYISMSSSELHTLYKAFTDAGGHWSTFLIWVKDTFTLGRSNYHRLYEPVLFGWKEGGPHYFCGARNLGDVWFIDKPRVNDLHPTMKPVELVERAILHSSKRGDLVLDPFAGAGVTLIACQKTRRCARLIELDPKYVDVTIMRWQSYTRREAVLASNGRSFRDIAQERQH
jgi:DNA modification methylase